MCPILYFLHILFYIIYSIIQNNMMYKITIKSILEVLIGKTLVGEWFTVVIFLCYLLFPILKHLYKTHRFMTTIVLFLVFVINQKLTIFNIGGERWFSYANGLFEFWLGMIFIGYKAKLKKVYLPFLAVSFICILFLELKYNIDGILFYIPTLMCGILLFLMLSYFNIENAFVSRISKYSYETYLVHHQIMYLLFPVFAKLMVTQKQYMLFFILTMLLIYIISEKLNILNTGFVRKIKRQIVEYRIQKKAL